MSFVEYIITKCFLENNSVNKQKMCRVSVWSGLCFHGYWSTQTTTIRTRSRSAAAVSWVTASARVSPSGVQYEAFSLILVCFFVDLSRRYLFFFLNRYNDSYSQCNQGSAPDDHGDEIRSRSIQIVWISAGLFHKPKQFSKWLAIKKII